MTYELSIERIDEVETDPDEVRAALARVHTAGHEMRAAAGRPSHEAAQAAMIAALVGLYEASPGEMELTAGTLTDALNAMDRLGMVVLDAVPPKFPQQADFGVTPEMWGYDEDEAIPAELGAYLAAMSKATDAEIESPPGIPLYKLKTNDGWLITEAEIRAALDAYAAPRPESPSAVTEPDFFWWPHWMKFLELAAKHGGIRVN